MESFVLKPWVENSLSCLVPDLPLLFVVSDIYTEGRKALHSCGGKGFSSSEAIPLVVKTLPRDAYTYTRCTNFNEIPNVLSASNH